MQPRIVFGKFAFGFLPLQKSIRALLHYSTEFKAYCTVFYDDRSKPVDYIVHEDAKEPPIKEFELAIRYYRSEMLRRGWEELESSLTTSVTYFPPAARH